MPFALLAPNQSPFECTVRDTAHWQGQTSQLAAKLGDSDKLQRTMQLTEDLTCFCFSTDKKEGMVRQTSEDNAAHRRFDVLLFFNRQKGGDGKP